MISATSNKNFVPEPLKTVKTDHADCLNVFFVFLRSIVKSDSQLEVYKPVNYECTLRNAKKRGCFRFHKKPKCVMIKVIRLKLPVDRVIKIKAIHKNINILMFHSLS